MHNVVRDIDTLKHLFYILFGNKDKQCFVFLYKYFVFNSVFNDDKTLQMYYRQNNSH